MYEYATAQPEEHPRIAHMTGYAFAIPESRRNDYVELQDPETIRVIRAGAEVAGSFLLLPMGQWFGGRSVSMGGIGAVAVAPEHRGRGAGAFLMKEAVLEMRERGFAISTLYPATQPLYRRVGYELAGSRYTLSLDPGSIAMRERELVLRPTRPDDDSAVERMESIRASRNDGCLDRPALMWRRIRTGVGDPPMSYVVEEDGELTGFLSYGQVAGEFIRHELRIRDLVATTPKAARRILTLLSDHRSVVERVQWSASPSDPILALLQEQAYQCKLSFHWMVRIMDVRKALTERGYPSGMRCAVAFEIEDEVIPENAGTWTLQVEDGVAEVVRGGTPAARMHVRGLSQLFTGHASPWQVAGASLLEGDAKAFASLRGLFSGPLPWMADMF